MTERDPSDDASSRFVQGFRWEGDDAVFLAETIDAAFDYRGDVTLFLKDGAELNGYLANRDGDVEEPFVELFVSTGGRRRILYRDLRGLAFTGKNTASGKSWETWLKKYKAKKAAEALGKKTESIDLFPEPLD